MAKMVSYDALPAGGCGTPAPSSADFEVSWSRTTAPVRGPTRADRVDLPEPFLPAICSRKRCTRRTIVSEPPPSVSVAADERCRDRAPGCVAASWVATDELGAVTASYSR